MSNEIKLSLFATATTSLGSLIKRVQITIV